MNKDIFFSNKYIMSFLNDFEKKLLSLPFEMREQYISEIKSDLYENAIELSKMRFKDNEIPQEVLKGFVPSEKIANEILEEHRDDFANYHKENNKVMKYYTVFSVGAFGALALPILFGEFNLSSNLPFIIFFVISNIWLFSKKDILWNKSILGYFHKMIYFTQSIIIAIPLGLFAIRIIITKKIEEFSLFYLLVYLLITILYLSCLKYLQKNKQA